jgi:hypothetical protein
MKQAAAELPGEEAATLTGGRSRFHSMTAVNVGRPGFVNNPHTDTQAHFNVSVRGIRGISRLTT